MNLVSVGSLADLDLSDPSGAIVHIRPSPNYTIGDDEDFLLFQVSFLVKVGCPVLFLKVSCRFVFSWKGDNFPDPKAQLATT